MTTQAQYVIVKSNTFNLHTSTHHFISLLPNSHIDEFHYQNWIMAMKGKYVALIENKTCESNPRLSNANVI